MMPHNWVHSQPDAPLRGLEARGAAADFAQHAPRRHGLAQHAPHDLGPTNVVPRREHKNAVPHYWVQEEAA